MKLRKGPSGHYAEHLSTHVRTPEECPTCGHLEAVQTAYNNGYEAGESAMKEKAVNLLEAETYHSAYAAEIQSAIRALPLSGAEESKKEKA